MESPRTGLVTSLARRAPALPITKAAVRLLTYVLLRFVFCASKKKRLEKSQGSQWRRSGSLLSLSVNYYNSEVQVILDI